MKHFKIVMVVVVVVSVVTVNERVAESVHLGPGLHALTNQL